MLRPFLQRGRRRRTLHPAVVAGLDVRAAQRARDDAYAAQPWRQMGDWANERQLKAAKAAWEAHFYAKGLLLGAVLGTIAGLLTWLAQGGLR